MDNDRELFGVRFANWVGKYLFDLITFIACIAYICWGLISIKESGKTVAEILAGSLIGLAMGTSLSLLLGKKGIMAGLASKIYTIAINSYGTMIDSITDYLDELDNWCDYEYETVLKRKQMKILARARIKYETFISEEFNINDEKYDKLQRKLYYKALNVKVYNLTATNLLSNSEMDDETDKKEVTITSHNVSQFGRNFVIKLVFAITFSYFVVDTASGANLSSIIYSTVQTFVWLLFGIIQYWANYSFITVSHVKTINGKKDKLNKFKLWAIKKKQKELI